MSEETPSKQTTWQAESDYPEQVAALRAALQTIVDPEIRLSVVQLGLIRDVVIDEERVVITMILTTPFCPYGPSLMEATRQKAEETLGKPTSLAYGEEAWDFSYMEDGLASEWGLY
jgi:metal-sulfur cluster biosynthetic enzyme